MQPFLHTYTGGGEGEEVTVGECANGGYDGCVGVNRAQSGNQVEELEAFGVLCHFVEDSFFKALSVGILTGGTPAVAAIVALAAIIGSGLAEIAQQSGREASARTERKFFYGLYTSLHTLTLTLVDFERNDEVARLFTRSGIV